MKQLIFWTGIISIASGIALQSPRLANLLMPSEQAGLVMHLFSAMAVFLGVMLILCTRDLRRRGSIVAWEGILRLFGCAFMIGDSIFGAAGMTGLIGGIFDGAIGVAYLVGLPRHLGVSLIDLLLDRTETS